MQKFEINVFIKILLDFFLWGQFFLRKQESVLQYINCVV